MEGVRDRYNPLAIPFSIKLLNDKLPGEAFKVAVRYMSLVAKLELGTEGVGLKS